MSSASDRPGFADRLIDDAITGPTLPAHLYFHVPFCSSKCAYCDFYSVAAAENHIVRAVFAGLRAEVHLWSSACLPGVIESIYFGGGTPMLQSEEVARLLRWTCEQLPVRDGAEITIEANPESLTVEALEAVRDAGATRISVGVQSFDDRVLKILGRQHNAEQARRACELVVNSGLELSVDLMCGVLCGADARTAWQRSLYEVVETQARHVSVYPLQLEESTPMRSLVDRGLMTFPDEDAVAEELEYGADWLTREGLLRYEVANYAVPGYEAVHNTAYWLGRQYLGFGPGAHGMLDSQTASTVGVVDWESSEPDSRIRYSAPRSIEAWLTGGGQQVEVLSGREAAVEDVMLGLRLVRGVPAEQVSAAGLDRVLESLADDRLVELVGQESRRWRTTERGWLLGNEVFGRVWGAVMDGGDAPASR